MLKGVLVDKSLVRIFIISSLFSMTWLNIHAETVPGTPTTATPSNSMITNPSPMVGSTIPLNSSNLLHSIPNPNTTPMH